MVFTNFGKQSVAFRLGSSTPTYIGYIGVGNGSGTVGVTNEALISEKYRQAITGSPDFSTDRKVGFQADFNSIQMSGMNLMEFGLFHTGSATNFPGSLWQREAFGSVVFDGTNELQIISVLEIL